SSQPDVPLRRADAAELPQRTRPQTVQMAGPVRRHAPGADAGHPRHPDGPAAAGEPACRESRRADRRWRNEVMIRLTSIAGAVLALAFCAGSAQAQWGTIKGQVVFDGPIPAKKKANVDKDKDHCLAKGDIYTDDYVVDPKTRGVRWVVVWLIDAKDPK